MNWKERRFLLPWVTNWSLWYLIGETKTQCSVVIRYDLNFFGKEIVHKKLRRGFLFIFCFRCQLSEVPAFWKVDRLRFLLFYALCQIMVWSQTFCNSVDAMGIGECRKDCCTCSHCTSVALARHILPHMIKFQSRWASQERGRFLFFFSPITLLAKSVLYCNIEVLITDLFSNYKCHRVVRHLENNSQHLSCCAMGHMTSTSPFFLPCPF